MAIHNVTANFDVFRASPAGDTINLNGFSFLHEYGNIGNDIFQGLAFESYLAGDGGNDQYLLIGGQFNTVVMGNGGSTYFATNENVDVVVGGDVNDSIGMQNGINSTL